MKVSVVFWGGGVRVGICLHWRLGRKTVVYDENTTVDNFAPLLLGGNQLITSERACLDAA